ncbi:MAG: ATP-dependent acyl-CoA ligase [Candidatus Latescibacteria bacterium]|nr:ATP-dependent acyl-CoA ligase [Candidatus Latescibacterota bacterium]
MTVVGRRTLRSVLEYWAVTQPAKTFLIFEASDGSVRQFSYLAFDRAVNRTANALRGLGVLRGDRVLLGLTNSPEFLYLWFGAAKLGAVMVPASPGSTADELAYLAEHSESRVLFAEPDNVEILKAVGSRVPGVRAVVLCGASGAMAGVRLFDDLICEASEEAPEEGPASSDEAAILYTSGTTSRPKGVLITHAAYLYGAEAMARAVRLLPDDRHLVVLPLFHAAAQVHATLPSLLVGGSVALTERFSASRFFDQAIRYDATAAALFAAPIRMILGQPERPDLRQNRLRFVTFAQNVTEAQMEDWDRRFGAPLMQLWGMTETVGLPLMNPAGGLCRNMSMGLPVLGYECRVVDGEGREVATDEVGELIVRGTPGQTLMKGYFKNPEATREALRGEWLYSGDRARVDEAGYFHFVDRAKDTIKRAGENISSSEVEAVLKTHPSVADAAVVGVPDPVRDEAVKAFVILKEGCAAGAEELISWCAERLSKYKAPERVEFRREFPRTAVGKVQKHLLKRT